MQNQPNNPKTYTTNTLIGFMTYDPVSLCQQVHCGYVCLSDLHLCPVQLWESWSPQSMQHAVSVKFHMCTSVSVPPVHYLLLHTPTLLHGLAKEWNYDAWLCKQTHIRGFHTNQWTQFRVPPPSVTSVITLNKQTLSPPVHEAFRTWTFEGNSRISEYLGQHEILDLSGNTD